MIKEICEKYNGNYFDEGIKGVNTPGGKMTSHLKKGNFIFEGSKIEISIREAGGAALGTEPYRFVMDVNNEKNKTLTIYPNFLLDRIVEIISFRKRNNIPAKIKNKFQFKGDFELIERIANDQYFTKLIDEEILCIYLKKEHPNKLILTPTRGIKNMKQAEKFISILKIIEEKI